jgi:A/G-specific adenine glycosylase
MKSQMTIFYLFEKTCKMENFVLIVEQWYQRNKRSLPWREGTDPYPIWLSEVMSQQTTITSVLPYYRKFIKKFPTLKDFANAEIGEILKMWTGLGYPSRARNMHKAAQLILKSGYPTAYNEWLQLPGVGPYTAAAVSSIAFGHAKGVVDGNVIRFYSRYLGQKVQHWLPKGRRQIQAQMDEWIQYAKSPGDFNQAIMELGATICTKLKPVCTICPVRSTCQAARLGLINELPMTKPRAKTIEWSMMIYLLRSNNKVLVQKQSESAPFLKNQWTFPYKLNKVHKTPAQYDFVHRITKNKIYVTVQNGSRLKETSNTDLQWWTVDEFFSSTPSSLFQKALAFRD